MNIRWVLVAAVLVVILSFVWRQSHGTENVKYRALTASWQAVFNNRDGATAYALYLQAGATMQSEDAHTLAHVVGAILYDRYGLDGLRYCTHDFNYGCYHGFAGHVIEQRGLAGVAPLMDACEARDPKSCRHGVGHGLMAYMGDDRLNDALTYCPTESSGPCTSGVFMEYFLNTMRRSDVRGVRIFDPQDPSGPCAVVTDQRHMEACYYGLPALWRVSIERTTPDITEQFSLIGRYCEHMSKPEFRRACFAGSGALAAPSGDFDERTVTGICAVMPEGGRDACQTEAMNAMKQKQGSLGV